MQIPLFFAFAVFAGSSLWMASSEGQEPEVDFAHDLVIQVGDVFYVGQAPEDLQLRVARLVDGPASLLANADFYRGLARPPQGSEEVECTFAHLPLTGSLEGARLTMAVDADGALVNVGVWGIEEFDADPYGTWGALVSSMMSLATSEGIDGAQTLAEAEERLAALDEEEERRLRAHLDLRRLMQGLQQYSNLARRTQRGGLPLPKGFVGPFGEELGRLEELAPSLAPLLTEDERERFARNARSIRAEVAEFDRLTGLGDATAVQEFVGRSRSSSLCTSCHNEPLESGGTWRRQIGSAIRADVAPQGLLAQGFDLPPALGDHDGWSSSLAQAFRATLYALRGLDHDR
jgi:hypothetical protein